MPRIIAGIQTDYVVEVMAETQIETEQYSADEISFTLVNQEDFINSFHRIYPNSPFEPNKIWHNLLGNEPSGEKDGLNQSVCYLTIDSCEQILMHYPLFISGIDFKHLPSGFFLAKNPISGINDVLHFSHFIATHKPQNNPLAIVLSKKTRESLKIKSHDFTSPKLEWYEFLRSKMSSSSMVFCTEDELRKAFIKFSNILDSLNLTFGPLDLTTFAEDFNPIVLLGRWAQVLTQPYLEKKDLHLQWQQLLQMDFTRGYSPLRAITDYLHTRQPARFIVRDMFEGCSTRKTIITYNPDLSTSSVICYKYNPARDMLLPNNISNNSDFWRYIAFQEKRNSIDFYQKALAILSAEEMVFTEVQLIKLKVLLANCVSGNNHKADNNDEATELEVWSAFCKLVNTIHTKTAAMRAISAIDAIAGGGGNFIKNNVIKHLSRLSPSPNIYFLNSIAEYIEQYIEKLDPVTVTVMLAALKDPLNKLEELSNKLNSLITIYTNDFYQGARFYFISGLWAELGIKHYIELQYELNKIKYAKIIIPYTSTFAIKSLDEGVKIAELLEKVTDQQRKNIIFALSLFKDIHKQQTTKELIELINACIKAPADDSLLLVFAYVEQNFATPGTFPQGYFIQKRQQILDAQQGLSEEQKNDVRSLMLLPQQTEAIISIESALVRKNNTLSSDKLKKFNELFLHLSYIIAPTDFTQFLLRLKIIYHQLPEDYSLVEHMLAALLEERRLESFNQIYLRNSIEKCGDESLISRILIFVTKIKSLGKAIGVIDKQTVQDLLAIIVLNCDQTTLQTEGLFEQIKNILDDLQTTVEAHPHIAHHLLELFHHCKEKSKGDYLTTIRELASCSNSFTKLLATEDKENASKEMLTIFSLYASYHKEPTGLIHLWKEINKLEGGEQKKFFLGFITDLLENKQSIDGFELLITTINTKPGTYALLTKECAHPPYPSIEHLNQWLTTDEFQQHYDAYSMQPYGTRHIEFAFNLNEFEQQKGQFNDPLIQNLLVPELAVSLDKLIKCNRQRSIHSLRQEFVALSKKELTPEEKQQLLCVCIEMLSRTAAQWDHSTPPVMISQELNTTQVLALYLMLVHPGNKLISEIDTGEGKSRINMILAACMVAQEKTVDFMTSDMPLAIRDYLSYHAFYKSLGIRSSLISLHTPKQLYQKGGVNFSDNSQLLLLRNHTDISGDFSAFITKEPEKRCLLIDEVDKFTHDKSKYSYNYATSSKTLREALWIYPLFARFARETIRDNFDYPFDAEGSIEAFVRYVAVNDIDDAHQVLVDSLQKNHRQLLITWLNSASIALRMRVDQDYKISEKDDSKLFLICDAEGCIRHTRKVFVLDNGRPVESSTFAAGIHQCICAIENEKAGTEEFVIMPENEIQRSSYPVSFLAQYKTGTIFGCSGTTRSAGPTSSSAINYEQYSYIKIPRQKNLRRQDKKVWGAKNEQQQIEFIKQSLMEKLKETPKSPVLIICKNDQQSQLLYKAFLADSHLMALATRCNYVHGLTEKTDELDAIKTAGEPGTLTLSTVGMFGRGVDINAENLYVISAYVPTLEDEKQIKGRTGRAGKLGEYRMIINFNDADSPVNGSTYNTETEIDKVQKKMAINAINQEETAKLYASFLEHVHLKFLNDYHSRPPMEQLAMLHQWQKYLNELQKAWSNRSEQFIRDIDNECEEHFINSFKEFTKEWEEKAHFIKKNKQNTYSSTPAQTIYTGALAYKGFFTPERQPINIQKTYDVADDGKATRYDSFFVQWSAVLRGKRSLFADFHAWREGRGNLFPDLMATLRGERPLFANLRATISRLIKEFKEWREIRNKAPTSRENEKKIEANSAHDNWPEKEPISLDDREQIIINPEEALSLSV